MPLSDYDPIFQSAAKEWNLDPTLLKSVAAQESGGNPNAASPANAQGLMQIIPATQKYLGVTDPTDPVQSIYGAAKYLSEGLDKEGTPEGALLYYHGGPAWRSSYGPESQAYVPGVTAHYKQLSAAQPGAAPSQSPPAHAEMSDADFLKSTGGTPSGPAVEDDASFLARTGGKAAPAPTPNPDAGANEYGITEDTGKPQPLTPAEKGVSDTLNAIGQGAKEGFGSSPIGMSPQTDQSMVNAGVFNGPNEYNPLKAINRAIVTPLAAAGDLALRSGQALVGAYQRGVSQAGESAGAPQLGRDLAALPEAFPTGDTGGGALVPHAPIGAAANPLVREISPAAHDALDAPLSASFRENPGVTAPSMVGHTEPNPLALPAPRETSLVPAGTPAPQSAGAAASASDENGLTPAQVQSYRSTAEGSKLLEPQVPGERDTASYVPGVAPSAAEIEQNVNTSRELKSLGIQSPEVSQEAKEIAVQNSEKRKQFFQQTAGSPVDVQNAIDARSAQAKTDIDTAFGNKQPTDATPVATTIQDILSGPRNSENTALQKYIQPLADRLYDADGQMKTDPEQLYGLREEVARMQSKAAKIKDPTLDHVSDELQAIKGSFDNVIEGGAPGYKQYMQNYSDASRNIDQMQALQEFEPRLYGANNRMTYNGVQRMMKNVVDARMGQGLNKYKSITDDTMQRLWALRDDLRRSASAQELASAPNSDSAQNLWDIMKGVGKTGADMAVHGAILAHTGPIGNVAYQGVRSALTSKLAARSAHSKTARGMDLLRPKTELYNPLASP